jgi:predicted LPLAT superfamily acyltransferase
VGDKVTQFPMASYFQVGLLVDRIPVEAIQFSFLHNQCVRSTFFLCLGRPFEFILCQQQGKLYRLIHESLSEKLCVAPLAAGKDVEAMYHEPVAVLEEENTIVESMQVFPLASLPLWQ